MSDKTMELEKTKTLRAPETSRYRRTFIPRVDIYETEDSIVLLADMPGVSEDSIDITLERDQLNIKGYVNMTDLADYEQRYSEYAIGDYRRSFTLSDEVNKDEIEATLKNGVLKISLTKAETAKLRKISVRNEN
jgi:HSP20 family molecular chaperone IbpA